MPGRNSPPSLRARSFNQRPAAGSLPPARLYVVEREGRANRQLIQRVGEGVDLIVNLSTGNQAEPSRNGSFDDARTDFSFPASGWAEAGRARVALSPVIGSTFTEHPASSLAFVSSSDLPAAPGSGGMRMVTAIASC